MAAAENIKSVEETTTDAPAPDEKSEEAKALRESVKENLGVELPKGLVQRIENEQRASGMDVLSAFWLLYFLATTAGAFAGLVLGRRAAERWAPEINTWVRDISATGLGGLLGFLVNHGVVRQIEGFAFEEARHHAVRGMKTLYAEVMTQLQAQETSLKRAIQSGNSELLEAINGLDIPSTEALDARYVSKKAEAAKAAREAKAKKKAEADAKKAKATAKKATTPRKKAAKGKAKKK